MRFKGKKPIVSRKDTWDLTHSLDPIILAHLVKFKEVISEPDCIAGVPNTFLANNPVYDAESIDVAFEAWLKVIDQIIYAFENNEPDLADYDFEFERIPHPNGSYSLEPTNQAEYDRLRKDETEHERKQTEGLKMFAEYYRCLWW